MLCGSGQGRDHHAGQSRETLIGFDLIWRPSDRQAVLPSTLAMFGSSGFDLDEPTSLAGKNKNDPAILVGVAPIKGNIRFTAETPMSMQ